ncbi:MAG: hypothetical protein NPIRA05_08990 [Nitrospirales bacterium]|nr:MAG: hypothetical protein NPIRA05_08990 [Nitrospirales bacterium]
MNPISIKKLCELKYGKSLRKDKRSHGRVPVYGSNGIVDYHDQNFVEKATIIIGRKGSIGEIHYVNGPSWPIDTTYFVELKNEYQVDLQWFYRILRSLNLPELNRAAAIPGLNRDDVYRIEIPLPPLDDQIRIAHLHSKVEGLIAQRKQHLQQLDDLLKSVFMEMFGDPVSNPKQHKISALGSFITHLTSGGRGWAKYYSENGRRFIRSLDVQMNAIGTEDIVHVNPPKNKETDRTRVQSGDVLLTITGSKIGRVCFVSPGFEEAYISQHVAMIRTQGINPVFLSYYISMPNCGQRIIKKQQYGQAKPGLNLPQIRNFLVLEPDPDLQNHFEAIVEKVEAIKTRYKESLTNLEILYGALSQKAFKGELDLTRIVLPAEDRESTEEKPSVTSVASETEPPPTIDLPAPDDLKRLLSAEGRKAVIKQWLDSYIGQLGSSVFAANSFMEAAQQRLWELLEDSDPALPELGVAEYDHFKTRIFQALENGHLTQSYDEAKNRVQVKSALG